ncbi:hypothetical protein [Streptomyces sp. NPDC054865]
MSGHRTRLPGHGVALDPARSSGGTVTNEQGLTFSEVRLGLPDA